MNVLSWCLARTLLLSSERDLDLPFLLDVCEENKFNCSKMLVVTDSNQEKLDFYDGNFYICIDKC